MRTTVTLDPDVERLIRDTMRERGTSFKDALNDSIRAGLSRERVRQSQKFVQKTYSLGDGQEFRWDKSLSIAEAMEDEELSRKMALRK